MSIKNVSGYFHTQIIQVDGLEGVMVGNLDGYSLRMSLELRIETNIKKLFLSKD
jgi:hypothetical protein